MNFYRIINQAIKDQGSNAADVSMRAVGNMVYSLKKGHPPNAENLKKLCDALGLEFYIGPPRHGESRAEPQDGQPDVGPAAQPSARAEAALAADLARYLGLPEGASVAEAVQAIKTRAATIPSTTTLSRDEVAAMSEPKPNPCAMKSDRCAKVRPTPPRPPPVRSPIPICSNGWPMSPRRCCAMRTSPSRPPA